MSQTLEDFLLRNDTSAFSEVTSTEDLVGGGGLIVNVSLLPEQAYELLEVLFGDYSDIYGNFVFIDQKVTWERCFKTTSGILRVYDYRGSVSIGYSGNLTSELKKDALEFKSIIENAYSDFVTIKQDIVKEVISANPLNNFTETFLAVELLLDKAKKNKAHLECLVLSVAKAEALLRFCLILDRQIKNSNKIVERKLVYQDSPKDFYSERQIFEMALNSSIISPEEKDELDKIYEDRNKAVHRYFISDFEYSHLKDVLSRIDDLIQKIGNKCGDLERQQVELGVGMTTKEHLEIQDSMVKRMIEAEQRRVDSSKSIAVIPRRKLMFPDAKD